MLNSQQSSQTAFLSFLLRLCPSCQQQQQKTQKQQSSTVSSWSNAMRQKWPTTETCELYKLGDNNQFGNSHGRLQRTEISVLVCLTVPFPGCVCSACKSCFSNKTHEITKPKRKKKKKKKLTVTYFAVVFSFHSFENLVREFFQHNVGLSIGHHCRLTSECTVQLRPCLHRCFVHRLLNTHHCIVIICLCAHVHDTCSNNKHLCVCVCVVRVFFCIILYVNCFGRTVLYMCTEYHI